MPDLLIEQVGPKSTLTSMDKLSILVYAILLAFIGDQVLCMGEALYEESGGDQEEGGGLSM